MKTAPFAAAGDGITDDTEAIRRALRAVERSGGVVYFPNGRYLLSNVLVHAKEQTHLSEGPASGRAGTAIPRSWPPDTPA